MATIAHTISKVLPKPVANGLRPLWHRLRDLTKFVIAQGGRLAYDGKIGEWVASRSFDGRRLYVVVRSFQEFRRFHQFGMFADDIVQHWMRWIEDCEVLYDIGSANGLEGFYINHLHRGRIVFVEPFTPSVETILKTICVIETRHDSARGFEVVQAACDVEPTYQRLYMHGGPIPGVTNNSFAHLEEYDRGGRQDRPVVVSQWVPSISLDSLHWTYGLPLATHVKIDIDGFEDRAMRGATRLLESGNVKSWAIEINGQENLKEIGELMEGHGYRDVASWEHYPEHPDYAADHIYVQAELVPAWRKFTET
tara:strand:+ start:300 stop:1226 length:927 start_codon:yes stop_codon:yes gene_type:complete